MPFDFNETPVRVYGIWPETPFPVEVSAYGYCQMACSYCFANRNRDAAGRELNPVNSAPAMFRKLDRAMADPADPVGFFLRERYPVCFSNTTDPFQREEKRYRVTEAFLGWAQANRVPVFVQTRGNVLYEEWERYRTLLEPGRTVVYLSVCQLDDEVRRRHEPGALRLEARWELAGMLRDHGIPVVAACNPYVREWVPDPDAYAGLCASAGVKGVWWESLHFTAAQQMHLAKAYGDLPPLANRLPMFLIGDLKRWYAALGARGLDFFPSPKWDSYFGHRAAHPECADPAWLGSKTFDYVFRLAARLYKAAQDHGRQVLFGWKELESGLKALGCPNPTLRAGDFWYPFNAQVKADRGSWNARLGKVAPLYEVLRYFWNHPYESQNFLWYHPLLQGVYYTERGKYAVDEEGDLVGCFDPKFNKHHGTAEIDHDSVDWDGAIWPNFN